MVRAYLLRSLLILGVLMIAWVVGGRSLASILDCLLRGRRTALPVTSLKYDGGGFVVDGVSLTFAGQDNRRTDLKVHTDAEQRAVLSGPKLSFVLGPRTDRDIRNGQVDLSFAAELGDAVSLTVQRSALGWPTPFEVHILSTASPWWRRYVYFRLTWKKPTGSTLEILWRYEQQYYRKGGWTEPAMMWNSATGLSLVQVRVTN